MKRLTTILLTVFLSHQAYSQTTIYEYSCGNERSTIAWTESKDSDLICFKTIQGAEVQEYVLNGDYTTLSWSYKNAVTNTDLTTTKISGNYTISGKLNGNLYSKTFKSKGLPWYQNIGFNIGRSMTGKQSYKFECIRPDNQKLYEMQADAKETIVNNGVREQRINIHLTGMLSKFFGSDYYIDSSTKQYIRYKGVHGAPGTPETIITIKK